MLKKPVIFLAFANDKVDDAAYLRNLPKELDGIRNALQKAVKAGLCEVIERASATIDNILDVFQDELYKDRIAVFHYGGHANGYQLLLETLDGKHASAHSEGLVSFLAKQQGLQLVFLNGCSSQQQSLELLQAGIPAVVGTSQSISDDVATRLSIRFYKGLASGSSIDQAWQEAVDEVKIHKGTANMRDLFWDGADEVVADAFPWNMHFREGAELVRKWNLPDAAGNPLFGLPDPPRKHDLPEKPYRFLERYKREHAELFFGRSYYVRELYTRVTDRNSAPIILFYGQSGVGKSSLLDAGLLPRLEQQCEVLYIRRDAKLGLLGSLVQALGGEQYQPTAQALSAEDARALQEVEQIVAQLRQKALTASANTRQSLLSAIQLLEAEMRQLEAKAEATATANAPAPKASIAELWKARESDSGRPLVILLDQVEEIYTKPNRQLPHETELALKAIAQVFGKVQERPAGKLILSYRKEYNPEIEEAIKKLQLPRETVFLRKMEKRDIVEVVQGLINSERLRRQYRLSIDEELPYIIADDLLEDKGSPIAPVLQILLTKMWQICEDEEKRHFSVGQYQQLKKQGILMDDFFHEQMAQLKAKYPDFERSGLALDLLNYHTTALGTANSHSVEELRLRYGARAEQAEALAEEMKQLYLLSDAGTEASSLAHDTLAPIVQQQFRHSDRPGQRATLILENKALAYAQNPNAFIDVDDLRLVEEGASGMRIWMRKEEELVEQSRKRRAQLEADRKRNRFIIRMLSLGVVIGLCVALWQWRSASLEAKANALAAEALQQESIDPTLALRLSEQAYKISPSPSIWQVMNKILGSHEFYQQVFEGHTNRVLDVAVGNGFAYTVGEDSTLRKWKLDGTLMQHKVAHQSWVFANALSGSKLATAGADGKVKIWNTDLVLQKTIDVSEAFATDVMFSPSGDTLFAGTADGKVGAWLADGTPLWQVNAHNASIHALAYDAFLNRLFTASADSTVKAWRMTGAYIGQVAAHGGAVYDVDLLPDGRVASAGQDGVVKIWSANGTQEAEIRAQARVLAVLPNGWLATAGDYPATTAELWNVEGKRMAVLEGHSQAITAFASEGNYLITSSRDKTAKLWHLGGRQALRIAGNAPVSQAVWVGDKVAVANGEALRIYDAAGNEVQALDAKAVAVAVAPDGFLATANSDSTAKLWDAQGKEINSFALADEGMRVAFSADGQQIAVASRNHSITIWSRSGQEIATLEGHTENISGLAFMPDNRLASCAFDSTVRVWDVATKQASVFRPHNEAITSMAVLPDGRILTGGWDGYARIINADGQQLQQFQLSEDFVNAVAASADGALFALGSFDYSAGIFDGKGALVQAFRGHQGGVNTASFSANGQRLATGADDGGVIIWYANPFDYLNSGRVYVK